MSDVSEYSELYKYMDPYLPGIIYARPLQLQTLLMGLRFFCLKTEAWKEDIGPFNLIESQTDYVLDWEWCAYIERVTKVGINTEEGVDAGTDADVLDPSLYVFDQPETLRLDSTQAPAADVSQGLEVQVALVPKLDSTCAPTWLVNQYAEALIARTISELAIIPEKTWTNPSVAAKFEQVFKDKWTTALVENRRRNVDANTSFTA